MTFLSILTLASNIKTSLSVQRLMLFECLIYGTAIKNVIYYILSKIILLLVNLFSSCSIAEISLWLLKLNVNKMNCELMLTYDTPALRQTGSRNPTGPKMLPIIWYTYMTLVTKYQISAINSYWEKCDEKYLGRTDRRTEVKQYTPLPLWGAGV